MSAHTPLHPAGAVIFDFDGTIADSVPAVHYATNAILERFNYQPVELSEIVRGMPLETPARLAFHAGIDEGERSESMAVEFRALLLERAAVDREFVRPVERLEHLLDWLDDHSLAAGVVSNNDVALVERVLDAWGIRDRFGAVLAEGSGFDLKPAPGTTDECLRRLAVPRERAVFVGDGQADAAVAQAAGLYSIGVEWFPVVRQALDAHLPLFPRRVFSVAELETLLERWLALVGTPDTSHVSSEPPSGVRILFVRHCESEANTAHVLGSRRPYPLSAEGRRQAATVGAWIAERYTVSSIISSPLLRAQETAEAVAEATGATVRFDERLVEQELGTFSGLAFAEAKARGGYESRKEWRWHWKPEGGESYGEIYERVCDFLTDLGAGRLDSPVPRGEHKPHATATATAGRGDRPAVLVCVTHAVAMRCLHAALANTAPVYPTWLPSNGQVWEVTFSGLGHEHAIRIYDQEYAAGREVHA